MSSRPGLGLPQTCSHMSPNTTSIWSSSSLTTSRDADLLQVRLQRLPAFAGPHLQLGGPVRFSRRRVLHRLHQRVPQQRRRGRLHQQSGGPGPDRCCGSSPGSSTAAPSSPPILDPVRHLPEVGLPHVVLLAAAVLQPLLDEAERPLRVRGVGFFLFRFHVLPQPGDGARRGSSSRPGSCRCSSAPRSRRRGCNSRAARSGGNFSPSR